MIIVRVTDGATIWGPQDVATLRDAVVRAVVVGANLGEANLRGAYLGGADLGGANLGGADLGGANLRGADLGGADLGGANLGRANLRGANLRGANLREANLGGADLREADLRGAIGIRAPRLPHIDALILQQLDQPGCQLAMQDWHTCETTHCRAGWAIHLAGEKGYALEDRVGPGVAGALIYAASRPDQPIPDFCATDDHALADLRRCALADPLPGVTSETNAP